MNGEKLNDKNPTGWFLGHHSRNSTIITTSGYKQGIPSTLPTYSWTLTPIPNRTCSVVIFSLSDARLPSTWLNGCVDPSTRLQNTNLKRLLAAKFFSSSTQWRSGRCLVTKPYGTKYTATSPRKNFVFGHNLVEQSLLNACATCVQFDGSWNNPFICLGLGEKKAHKQIHGFQENQSWNLKFLNLDR